LEGNNKKPLLLVGQSPHVISPDNTRSLMLDVLIAMAPAFVAGIYFFGFRVLFMTAFSVASCMAFEYLYQYLMKKDITAGDLSSAVTGVLMVFVLPASVPFWMVLVGDFFAIVVVKQLFGGLGRNFMNPALAGRAFLAGWATLLNTYPADATNPDYVPLPLIKNIPLVNGQPDIVTSATPLASMKAGNLPEESLLDMGLGLESGCVGEVSAFLLILGGLYLLLRKVITIRIPLGYLGTVAILTLLFPPAGINGFTWMLASLLSGGLMLGAFFMATDYSTSPVTPGAQWVYAIGCGLLTFVIRYFGAYNEGVCYSILIMNSTVWLLDKYIRPHRFGSSKKVKAEAEAIMANIRRKNAGGDAK